MNHPHIDPSSTREWWRDATIYQVYPRSFADSDGDGVGDLRGVIDHLEYISDLGVDAIWLSPFFTSPMHDYGYDISDHCDVDPLFGSLADADALIAAAHRRGLKVVFDIVLGHTSHQHPWFRKSAASRDSPKRDWYVWRDGPTPGEPLGGPPNNWQAGFPRGASTWTWHEPTEQWYLHSHLPEQPDLDWTNPAVRRAQLEVIRFWLERGVDGLRLDSINRLGKDPELRDNVPNEPLRQQDWPSLHEYLRDVRALLDRFTDRMAVGEVWEFDQRRLLPYLAADELHLAHNFVFARLPFRADMFDETLREFSELAEDHLWPAWFLNNHDEPRVISRWRREGDSEAVAQARGRLAAVLLLTLRGTPFLYQGEELGLPDTELPAGVGTDLNGRDPQRTPLPWLPPSTAGPGAGFTTGAPWLPVDSSAETRNVQAQEADPDSMLNLYRQLLRLRRERPVLRAGAFHPRGVCDGVLLYARSAAGLAPVVVLANFKEEPRRIDLPALTGSIAGPADRWSVLASTGSVPPGTPMDDQIDLAGHGAVILEAT